MKRHNTPSLFTLSPPPKVELKGRELLYKLEDDYRDYREACENRLCESDPKIHAKFRTKIVELSKLQ